MERGTASGGASLLKEFHPVQTLQQVENYTASGLLRITANKYS
ncbi:hypothetical protein ACUOFC_64060, partial [Escherichia sp. TWPC-MK]